MPFASTASPRCTASARRASLPADIVLHRFPDSLTPRVPIQTAM
ncbi:hypothetical protein KKH3_31580 [Pectobacterium actinidiae]|nr:hypothetical protein KKH3_31580 [Pectobacterium actinidiae]